MWIRIWSLPSPDKKCEQTKEDKLYGRSKRKSHGNSKPIHILLSALYCNQYLINGLWNSQLSGIIYTGVVTYRSFPYPNSYKIGTDIISSGASKITSYLIEIVVCIAGFGGTTATGTYLINMTLLVGAAMSISNQQEVTTLIAFALEGIVFDR